MDGNAVFEQADRLCYTPAPEQVIFPLQDGNFIAGFHYRADHEAPLVVLLHGASDSHTVFDFAPGFRIARGLARRGFRVLTVDRVGYGQASRPCGDTLTFAVSAGYVHEVIDAVRAGVLGEKVSTVVLLGPSAGADVAIVEAGAYRDIDGIIVCFHTARLQPALSEVDVNTWFSQGDYFDFGTDFRSRFFYAKPWALDSIINLDNATRQLVPRAEIQSALSDASAPFCAQVEVPALLVQADHDELFVPQNDTALFSSSPDVSFVLLHKTGHKAFLHPTSKTAALEAIARWINQQFSIKSRCP
jgi:pimeloyl-ACP methyl ester carboxylesterase